MMVGIPGALLYHYYGPVWRSFIEALGHRVVTSGITTDAIMDQGVLRSPPEACVPLKVFMGHLSEFACRRDVDAVFVPRLCSVGHGYHFCPKIMGLPDLVKYAVPELEGKIILSPWIWVVRGAKDLHKPAIVMAQQLGVGKAKALAALGEALNMLKGRTSVSLTGLTGKTRVALLGYPYNVHDAFLSMDAGKKLESMGIDPIFLEHTDYKTLRENDSGGKNLFWTFSDWVYRAGKELMASGGIHGLIHITSFGCGPDAIVGKLLDLEAKVHGVPFMTIRIDEHTGESHLLTRLEAFADVVLAREVGI